MEFFKSSKIPNFFKFTREYRINCDIFGQKLRMEDVNSLSQYKHLKYTLNVK